MEDYEKNKNSIKIPFGAKDSELGGFEYIIPEGYEAEIKEGKVIVKKADSKGEKIRKWLIAYLENRALNTGILEEKESCKEAVDWLEKQKCHKQEAIDMCKDEEIREYLITYFSEIDDCSTNLKGKDIVAWLEKQGEQKLPILTISPPQNDSGLRKQKPADKVEPKFKDGDWISGYYTSYKVLSVNNDGYVVEDVDGNKINILFENEKFHQLWTIQDAKAGDVLVHNDCTFIFMGIKNDIVMALEENLMDGMNPVSFGCIYENYDYHPATKEQRDLLFQKMHEAGFEWNAEKKELRKIDEKSAWNEEDERILTAIHNSVDVKCLSKNGVEYLVMVDWFNSLKDRVQPKQEWSEEDKVMLDEIIDYMKPMPIFFESTKGKSGKEYTKEFIIQATNWLKSLRPQNHWKPSKEQMEAFEEAVKPKLSGFGWDETPIGTLYNDLMKL